MTPGCTPLRTHSASRPSSVFIVIIIMWIGLLLAWLSVGCLATDYYPRSQGGSGVPDKVEVVSSALRVLPRKRERFRRSPQWRKPRDYEFVTRSFARSPRRLTYPEDRSEQTDFYERRRDFPTRRIVYYATLPDVIRRPGEWTPPRPIYSGYPPNRDNEIVTRVHSGLIDVSNKYTQELPRFTIIDAEPPYARPPPPPYDHYDYRKYGYNRYDNRNQVEPYRYYEQPYRQDTLPPQQFTVVRQPIDVRPLDIRPQHPLSTQAPPLSSTTTQNPSSTSESSDISNFERTFKQ